MIYKIKESFWSFGDNFSITDQTGNPQYSVQGKVFSWGDDLSVKDNSGSEVARIRQKMLSLKPTYEILIGGNKFAEVVKEWTWFNKKFTLDVPGPNDYSISGSFWEHEFEFIRSGRKVANVSKNFWGWSDSYGVEILENDNTVSILCSCIVIDQILYDEKK